MAKKKGKGRSSTHMTSAERTRAKMRAQQQAEEARREAESGAAATRVQTDPSSPKADPEAQIDDIDAQIAELQRKRARLAEQPGGQGEISARERPVAKGNSASKEASSDEPKRQAYPGERRLRRAQGQLRLWTKDLVLITLVNLCVFTNHIMSLSTFPLFIQSLDGTEAIAGTRPHAHGEFWLQDALHGGCPHRPARAVLFMFIHASRVQRVAVLRMLRCRLLLLGTPLRHQLLQNAGCA